MRSLEDLNKEVDQLNLEIRRLLLNKNSFKEGIADKIAVDVRRGDSHNLFDRGGTRNHPVPSILTQGHHAFL